MSALYMGCPALTGAAWGGYRGGALAPPYQHPGLTHHGKSPQPLLRFTSFILFVPCGQPARPLNPPFIVHGAHKGSARSLISLMCLWTAAVALSASIQTLA